MCVPQVQLRALLLERTVTAVGLALLYSRLDLPHPLLRALVINLASVFVGIALDIRNRWLYVRLWQAAKLPGKGRKKEQ